MSHPQPSLPNESGAPEGKTRVIDSLWTFLVATAVLGPFALPLLWRNPRYRIRTKVVGSVAVLLFTWALIWASKRGLSSLLEELQAIQAQGPQ